MSQAILLLRGHRYEEAELAMLKGKEKYRSHPDFFGVLGVIYKSWKPNPRVSDARAAFGDSARLKSREVVTYEHWVQLEEKEGDLTRAAAAADKGLRVLPGNKKLLLLAGRVRTRLARQLFVGTHHEKAARACTEGRALLEQALQSAPDSDGEGIHLDEAIFRALFIACELDGDVEALRSVRKQWADRCPDDPNCETEWRRVARRLGLSK